MVHAREVEYTTVQSVSEHARVGKTLWPRLGDEETINDEVAFGGVKMGAAAFRSCIVTRFITDKGVGTP